MAGAGPDDPDGRRMPDRPGQVAAAAASTASGWSHGWPRRDHRTCSSTRPGSGRDGGRRGCPTSVERAGSAGRVGSSNVPWRPVARARRGCAPGSRDGRHRLAPASSPSGRENVTARAGPGRCRGRPRSGAVRRVPTPRSISLSRVWLIPTVSPSQPSMCHATANAARPNFATERDGDRRRASRSRPVPSGGAGNARRDEPSDPAPLRRREFARLPYGVGLRGRISAPIPAA